MQKNQSMQIHANQKHCLESENGIPRASDPDPDPPDPHVLGLPDPDPLVRGLDPNPAPDPSIIKQKY